jgi:hypothetical protein
MYRPAPVPRLALSARWRCPIRTRQARHTSGAEVGHPMDWQQRLASITGSVDEARLRRHDYLVTEHRLLRQQLTGRLPLF